MINLSLNELKPIEKNRDIKDYEILKTNLKMI